MPLEPKIREIAAEFQPGRDDFLTALAAFLSQEISRHRAGRGLACAKPSRASAAARGGHRSRQQNRRLGPRSQRPSRRRWKVATCAPSAWEKAARQWERRGVTEWSFGDLPETVVVEEVGGAPLLAYPGLAVREARGRRAPFPQARGGGGGVSGGGAQARRTGAGPRTRTGLERTRRPRALAARRAEAECEPVFSPRSSSSSAKLQASAVPVITPEVLQQSAYQHLLDHVLQLRPGFPAHRSALRRAARNRAARTAGARLPARRDAPARCSICAAKILAASKRYAGLEEDLQRLVPPDFLARTPHAQLPHLAPLPPRHPDPRPNAPTLSPAKDVEKAKQLAPFQRWETSVPADAAGDLSLAARGVPRLALCPGTRHRPTRLCPAPAHSRRFRQWLANAREYSGYFPARNHSAPHRGKGCFPLLVRLGCQK